MTKRTSRIPTPIQKLLASLLLAPLVISCGSDSGSVTGSVPSTPNPAPSPAKSQSLLVGNTRGNNVVRYDPLTGAFIDEFIPAGTGGLFSPDTILLGPDANGDGQQDLYIASGDKPAASGASTASAVLRFDGKTGALIDSFVKDDPSTAGVDEAGGLTRPYGMAFGPDGNLYVSSFLTDQILRYNGKTGQFIDVFATGNAQPGGLNGPNGLLFTPDGSLFVTTQGSVAVDGKASFDFNLPSQVLKLSPGSSQFSVFATPDPVTDAAFVSLLGLAIGPDNTLYVSDFANGIRSYNPQTGAPISVISTNYTATSPSSNFMGGLSFGSDGSLYTVGFDSRSGANNIGAILRYGSSQTTPTFLVTPDPRLNRPIGILVY